MVNTDLLNKAIESSGLKIGFIVEKLGISRQAFDRKVKGIVRFRAAEIYVLCDLLHLSDTQANKIFYPEVDAKSTLVEVI